MHQFNDAMGKVVSKAFGELLSTKHLYQTISVELGFVADVAKGLAAQKIVQPVHGVHIMGGRTVVHKTPTEAELIQTGRSIVAGPWIPDGAAVVGSGSNPISVRLPTVNTFCANCESTPPFNFVDEGSSCILGPSESQLFLLGFECQQCKGPPVRFLVRREGFKLSLVGRDPIEAFPVPKVLPRLPGKYYGDAQIAHHAGQTLAAIFLLRVFIEQFWRSIPAVQELVKAQPRATGDEQGRVYQGTLPDDFKNRFPSLPEIYGRLSAAMHEAKPDAALFEESCERIVEHFDARRLYKIP
jgi:hypothetical protein